jgi:hypothetical protein
VPTATDLRGECDAVIAQFAHVPALGDATQQRDELQRDFDTLVTVKTDLRGICRVGKALAAAKEAVAQQPLSEEDYVSLADRRVTLVQTVTAECERLAAAGDFDTMETLVDKLEELRALDLSALPHGNRYDPEQPPAVPAAEGPVPTPPLPPQVDVGAANDAAHKEEGQEEWANDPEVIAVA